MAFTTIKIAVQNPVCCVSIISADQYTMFLLLFKNISAEKGRTQPQPYVHALQISQEATRFDVQTL